LLPIREVTESNIRPETIFRWVLLWFSSEILRVRKFRDSTSNSAMNASFQILFN
jgi:hypothetical protein